MTNKKANAENAASYKPFKMLSIRFSSASDMEATAAPCKIVDFGRSEAAGMDILPEWLEAVGAVLLTLLEDTGGEEEKRPRISSSTLEETAMSLGTMLPWLLLTFVQLIPLLLLELLMSLDKQESESKSVLRCGLRGGLGLPPRSADAGAEENVHSRSGEPGVPTRGQALVPLSDKPKSSQIWLHLCRIKNALMPLGPKLPRP
jgi:hypothetical protein